MHSIGQTIMSTLKPHSNGILYSNTVIGIVATNGWTVTFGTARRGLAYFFWNTVHNTFAL